eukprot:CAMPEP_0117488692 /NCGR_PEP_ID=MMETSP0784-20121206/16646_1 /TAXON_ID=39447 /ORGANISM="" /LENGTH=318 /DNA_ID=CAMNT_0005283387 /DNA_START=51 /DNA_END=1007 /DNA_ORIENTATION=+
MIPQALPEQGWKNALAPSAEPSVGEGDVLSKHRENREGDGDVERHADHSRPSARIEERNAILLQDLRGAVERAFVQFLRLLALHARLNGILRHGQDDGHGSGHRTRRAVVNRVGLEGLVPAGHNLLTIKLHGKAHRLVRRLLGDGRNQPHVQPHRALGLQYLDHRVEGARVVPRAPAHVVCHAGLQRLDGRDREERLGDAAAGAGEHPRGHADFPILVLELLEHCLIARPASGLLARGAQDQWQGAAVQTNRAMLLHRFHAAVQNACVLWIRFRLQLELRLHELRRVADNCLDEASEAALGESADRTIVGVLSKAHCA